jgi:phosphatidylglycerol---prolipoprotein diacylglyceryl transferase
MIPFLHLGPLTIPTFGLCVAAAMVAAFFLLRADLHRRRIEAEAEALVAVPSLAGIAGAKLYHVLESPHELFADPLGQILSPFGFAWFGGLIAGFGVFFWMAGRIARRNTAAGRPLPLLEILDAGSPSAALGYGIGRIGCLLSGDGDYGIPTSLLWGMSFPNGIVPTTERVHPTPVYELSFACLVAWWLWRVGSLQVNPQTTGAFGGMFGRGRKWGDLDRSHIKEKRFTPRMLIALGWRFRVAVSGMHPPKGEVFAQYLVWTGLARFLVEFIRINPRSFFGLTNAQAASLASILAGAILWWRLWHQ